MDPLGRIHLFYLDQNLIDGVGNERKIFRVNLRVHREVIMPVTTRSYQWRADGLALAAS